jgi:peroxiredoxin
MKMICLAAFAAGCLVAPAVAAPTVDEAAPAFSGLTSNGSQIRLDQFKGKSVILEWTNDGCPFVRKHYETGNMQKTQQAAKDAGAVWITVISSAPGKQGYADAARANELAKARDAKADYILLDPDGVVGKAYGAKTTPQMALIDESGVLRYTGAIDDQPTANHASVIGAVNYILAALEDVESGEPVAVKETAPYGCSIKYKSE